MVDIVDLKTENPAYEWTVYQGKSFTVQVRGWGYPGSYKWNVYALIFDKHPFHQKVEAAMSLHFHWGTTYDARIVTTPARGIQYEWQKVSDCLKVGSDYQHHEDYFENDDPKNGIPSSIHWDAAVLAKELLDIEQGVDA